MLIGIDASRAAMSHPTGTEIYSQRLIQALLALESPHRFRLYFRGAVPPGLFPGADLCIAPFPRLWTHVRLSWEMARRPPDALFVPAHVVPLVHPPASLVTVHDLGYLHFPQAHPWQQRFYLDLSTRWSVRVSAHVLADSAATKADLVARYGTPPDKVTVAYPGRDETMAPVLEPAEIEAVKARHGIVGDYFLYVGTLQPRKNLVRLVKAFAALRPDAPSAPVERRTLLVLAGKRGWLYNDLFKLVSRLGLEGRVLFPGYVPNEDKAALMGGALAFVFPSLYEGFGLPVLEAQACGCPVITSTTSSLPEVAGDGALLVDPRDTGAIAMAMERVASDLALREGLVERGLAHVRRFSWVACARAVLSAVEQSARSMV
jgi:glycosyltransferase involved in cell wall biosynthesis